MHTVSRQKSRTAAKNAIYLSYSMYLERLHPFQGLVNIGVAGVGISAMVRARDPRSLFPYPLGKLKGQAQQAARTLATLQAALTGVLFSLPRASACGLSPGLCSPGPLGRFCQALLQVAEERGTPATSPARRSPAPHPREWPGVNTAAALLQGKSLTGHWIDRPRQYAARNRGEDVSDERFAVEETMILSPLPCWAHLSPERYRQRIEALVEEVEEEAARVRRRSGSRVLGVKAILAQNPQARPDHLTRSPAPLVHAATKAARRMFYELYAEFVSAFRTASDILRRGNRDAPFPAGSFPPALPFVAG